MKMASYVKIRLKFAGGMFDCIVSVIVRIIITQGPGFETTLRPVIKCEERICQLSRIPGKKARGRTRVALLN